MAEYADREHYIPLRKNDLIDLICADKSLPPADGQPLRQFCQLVSAVIHFEHQAELEILKDAYAPFDPDSETPPLKSGAAARHTCGRYWAKVPTRLQSPLTPTSTRCPRRHSTLTSYRGLRRSAGHSCSRRSRPAG